MSFDLEYKKARLRMLKQLYVAERKRIPQYELSMEIDNLEFQIAEQIKAENAKGDGATQDK